MATTKWSAVLEAHLQHRPPHTRAVLRATARFVADRLARHDGDVAAALATAVADKAVTCPRALRQVVRRLHATTNLVWHTLLGHLDRPLPMPAVRRVQRDADGDGRVFSEAEVAALAAAAQRHSVAARTGNRSTRIVPWGHVLIRLLFTTGLRIAAAADLRWEQVLVPTGDGVRTSALVREKGGRYHGVLFTREVRGLLWTLYRRANPAPPDRVLHRSVRQLRNVFYRVCHDAGLAGRHCHPHTARHTPRRPTSAVCWRPAPRWHTNCSPPAIPSR
jgi:integrase